MERRKLIRNAAGLGLAGIIGNKMNMVYGNEPSKLIQSGLPIKDGLQIDDWHEELTKRIAALEERGGGTLELGDGVYEISKPLRLPNSVSLEMKSNAVIRARSNFGGDTVIIKAGGDSSKFSHTSGWIRGGVIDGSSQPLTGLKVEKSSRLEIADLTVLNCTYKGIHLLRGGYEANITRVRCDVDLKTHYAPGSIGIHYERADSIVNLAHIIGYETGLRTDGSTNFFTGIHVWNIDPDQGPMLYCFYCNGAACTFNQCYADSPTIAGFYITKPHQSIAQSRVYYSRWAEDNSGAGFMITPEGKYGHHIVGNVLFANNGHKLAKAFDGDLSGSCILGNSLFGSNVLGGMENLIPSGELYEETEQTFGGPQQKSFVEYPRLNLSGTGFCMTQQTKAPLPEQGAIGEVRWVDDGKVSALWVKTPKGWKQSKLM